MSCETNKPMLYEKKQCCVEDVGCDVARGILYNVTSIVTLWWAPIFHLMGMSINVVPCLYAHADLLYVITLA